MKNRLTLSFIVSVVMLSFLGCSEPNTQNLQTPVENNSYAVDPSYSKLDWCNDLIRDYIARSKDEFLVLDRQDTSVHFEWYVDRIENENGKKFMIFHLGHEVSDEGNTNVRFVTSGWLYIDSLSRKLYVYDIAKDTIVLWK
jgi:hypothetical protein